MTRTRTAPTRTALLVSGDAIEFAAIQYRTKNLKAFRGDADMERTIRSDAGDLHEIAGAVRAGNLTEAKRLTRNLDTLVRDEIPQIAWALVGLETL